MEKISKSGPKFVYLWQKKQKTRKQIRLRVKKSLKYQAILFLLILLFFVFHWVEAKIVINEIMTENENSTKNEFVELYNTGGETVILDGYELTKKTKSGKESNLLASTKFFGEISARKYFLIAHPDYKDTIKADIEYSGSSYSIADDNSVLLYDAEGELLDLVGYGSAVEVETSGAPNPEKDKSIGRLDGKDTDDNSRDFTLQNPTPGEENEEFEDEPEPAPEPEIYSDEIWINELLPNPADGEDEYIELYNNSDEKIELKNWSLHDASKSGEYVFSEKDEIESEEYLAVYGETFKFALNNGGDEKISLYDPNKKSVFEVSYKGSKKGTSYNFDGEKWHWSSFLTPGTENIFEEIPEGKIKIDKKVFVEVFANFEVVGLSKKAKIIWDFGDGHKSYKPKTKHKYKKTGKYEASVKYSEGSEDVTEKFTIEVEKIKHPEVKIVAVNANPVGSDTKNETITVQNKSSKKINLKGWSIATGWKKLINHPITEDLEIKAGKTKEVTRKISKFTLNNSKNKIELRYPDGKVAHELKYKKEGKSIAEGEIYVKEKGGWAWQKTVASIKYNVSSINANKDSTAKDTNQINAKENEIEEIVKEDVEIVIKKKEMPALLAQSNKLIGKITAVSDDPQVLGAETIREVDGIYHFTPQYSPEKHYLVLFFQKMFTNINAKINLIINFFKTKQLP